MCVFECVCLEVLRLYVCIFAGAHVQKEKQRTLKHCARTPMPASTRFLATSAASPPMLTTSTLAFRSLHPRQISYLPSNAPDCTHANMPINQPPRLRMLDRVWAVRPHRRSCLSYCLTSSSDEHTRTWCVVCMHCNTQCTAQQMRKPTCDS